MTSKLYTEDNQINVVDESMNNDSKIIMINEYENVDNISNTRDDSKDKIQPCTDDKDKIVECCINSNSEVSVIDTDRNTIDGVDNKVTADFCYR